MNSLREKFVFNSVVGSTLLVSSLVFATAARAQAPPPAKAVASTASVSPAAPAPAAPDPPIQPVKTSDKTSDITLDPASLVPDLPPIPASNATLIGGTIEHIDPVQDEITIRVFGGGKIKALFDPRTNVSSNGKKGSVEELKTGQRIYADTILLNGTVFARNIRLSGTNPTGEVQGMVVAYRGNRNALELRDPLSPAPMNLRLTSGTRITRGNQSASTNDLVAGTLVSVNFLPEPGDRPVARQVTILITPGTEFTFNGQVTALDLHLGLLVVTSTADHQMYEVHFDPATLPISPDLRDGAEVTVQTRYEGNQYVARGLTVKKNAAN
jgi:hypothetical protein